MFSTVATIVWKDLKIELRSKEALSGSFLFCVIVLVVFNFTLDLNSEEARRMGAGFLWVAFAFGGILALNRSFALEREEGCAQALIVAPVDGGAVFLGKFLANVILMVVMQLLILPLFSVFYNVSVLPKVPLLLGIFALGSIGFSAVGTLFSAIAFSTRMRELMLPALALPISLPLLIAAVECTSYALGSGEDVSMWFKMLIIYDVVFVTAGFLGFEFVMEE